MATTRLMSLHISKGRTIAVALADSNGYDENPAKTNDGFSEKQKEELIVQLLEGWYKKRQREQER